MNKIDLMYKRHLSLCKKDKCKTYSKKSFIKECYNRYKCNWDTAFPDVKCPDCGADLIMDIPRKKLIFVKHNI